MYIEGPRCIYPSCLSDCETVVVQGMHVVISRETICCQVGRACQKLVRVHFSIFCVLWCMKKQGPIHLCNLMYIATSVPVRFDLTDAALD